MTFGERLAKARKEKEFTQEELAERLNLSRQTILRWEKNQVFPDISNLKAAAQILDVSFDYLLKENSREKPTTKASNLLNILIDKQVQLAFFEEYIENYLSVHHKNCLVLDIEDDMVQVQFEEKNELQMQVLPLSTIQAFTFVEEGGS